MIGKVLRGLGEELGRGCSATEEDAFEVLLDDCLRKGEPFLLGLAPEVGFANELLVGLLAELGNRTRLLTGNRRSDSEGMMRAPR